MCGDSVLKHSGIVRSRRSDAACSRGHRYSGCQSDRWHVGHQLCVGDLICQVTKLHPRTLALRGHRYCSSSTNRIQIFCLHYISRYCNKEAILLNRDSLAGLLIKPGTDCGVISSRWSRQRPVVSILHSIHILCAGIFGGGDALRRGNLISYKLVFDVANSKFLVDRGSLHQLLNIRKSTGQPIECSSSYRCSRVVDINGGTKSTDLYSCYSMHSGASMYTPGSPGLLHNPLFANNPLPGLPYGLSGRPPSKGTSELHFFPRGWVVITFGGSTGTVPETFVPEELQMQVHALQ